MVGCRPASARPSNTYRFETPDGRRYTARCSPNRAASPHTLIERSYYAALLLVGFVYLTIGVFVWRAFERLRSLGALPLFAARCLRSWRWRRRRSTAVGLLAAVRDHSADPTAVFHLFTTFDRAIVDRPAPATRAAVYALSFGLSAFTLAAPGSASATALRFGSTDRGISIFCPPAATTSDVVCARKHHRSRRRDAAGRARQLHARDP